MDQRDVRRRPSAQEQQRGARRLLVIIGVLSLVLVGGTGALAAMATSPRDDGARGEGGIGWQTLFDPSAPATPEQPEESEQSDDPEIPSDDARAADLALDPARNDGWSYKTDGEKIVYLTFDDGPSENTQRVLDVLDQYGVKATFFVTGHEPGHRDLIGEAYRRGHTVGMHTMTHDYARLYASEDAYFSDLDEVAQVVRDQIGYVPFLVRFPGGASNTVSANYCPGIMTTLSTDLPARGYQYYDWNVSSGDAAGTNVPADTIVSSSCVEGYTNIVLLMHDSNTKATTPEALPRIIEYYQERGYEFKALDRSSFVCHHAINN